MDLCERIGANRRQRRPNRVQLVDHEREHALTGLLKTLGLDKRIKDATDLKDYLEQRQKA